ncbi:hypothetical protein MSSAC_2399 [Methanosarcina siciliae C2J]|uniref:Uncharacterized protein n=1 Tax=Methanosarcina siciliae C2J TaxID=1434118 RepID=A0A0E3PN62_9EURY|nr:hypothetical protein [Methanosarcina siciliae]AKB36989.1 hypothetical protein MSSAC_2399 [Methanosarcina siciliae C2J]
MTRYKKPILPRQNIYWFKYPECVRTAFSIEIQLTPWSEKTNPEILFNSIYFEIDNDTHQITFTDELYLLMYSRAGIGELWLDDKEVSNHV